MTPDLSPTKSVDIPMLQVVVCKEYFNTGYIGLTAFGINDLRRCNDLLFRHILQEPVESDLSGIYCTANRFTPRFYRNLFRTIVKLGDNCKNIVHYWLVADENCVVFNHWFTSS